MAGFERIKSEVKAINELNKNNFLLRFTLISNISLGLVLAYSLIVSASFLAAVALFIVAINTVIMVSV